MVIDWSYCTGKFPYFKLNRPYWVVVSFLVSVVGYFHVHRVEVEWGTVLSREAYLEYVGLVGSVFNDLETRVGSVRKHSFSSEDSVSGFSKTEFWCGIYGGCFLDSDELRIVLSVCPVERAVYVHIEFLREVLEPEPNLLEGLLRENVSVVDVLDGYHLFYRDIAYVGE